MDFFFPDSQDQIDPRFDLLTEEHSPFHVRQRDDRYAHEVHDDAPYSGLLVSKTMVDGYGTGRRYTSAQRHRLYRIGVREFFRLPRRLKTLGDCGAFSYELEPEPPLTVAEVTDFYETCGFDFGISVDHLVRDYRPLCDTGEESPDDVWLERQALTLRLAADFLKEHSRRDCHFVPVGVAQGWSPGSYAYAVERLQELGYERIALGGMVPLRSLQILDCLEAIHRVRRRATRLHLLGITRTDHIANFRALGVVSFDSTSPFLQAFKDERDNYYVDGRTFIALRVPPSDRNDKLQARIRAGELDQAVVRRLEDEALDALRAYGRRAGSLTAALDALLAYEEVHDPKNAGRRTTGYRDMLEVAPWERCDCAVCRQWGIEVAIFRGTERNKRRGFHNLWVFNQTLQAQLAGPSLAAADEEEALV